MKAFILAAGMGKRLGPLTAKTPKPLVEVQGRPILDYTICRLINQGVTDIGINLHYHGDQIRDYVEQRNYTGAQFQFFQEDALLDTGGALLNARVFFSATDDFFILHNADVITNLALQPMIDQFHAEKPLALLATSQRPTSRPLLFNSRGQLSGRGKSNQTGAKAFNGIHIVSPHLFAHQGDFTPPFSIIDWYLHCANNNERIISYDMSDNQWFDVGTPERLAEANRAVLSDNYFQQPVQFNKDQTKT